MVQSGLKNPELPAVLNQGMYPKPELESQCDLRHIPLVLNQGMHPKPELESLYYIIQRISLKSLIKECTLNQNQDPYMLQGISLNLGLLAALVSATLTHRHDIHFGAPEGSGKEPTVGAECFSIFLEAP